MEILWQVVFPYYLNLTKKNVPGNIYIYIEREREREREESRSFFILLICEDLDGMLTHQPESRNSSFLELI